MSDLYILRPTDEELASRLSPSRSTMMPKVFIVRADSQFRARQLCVRECDTLFIPRKDPETGDPDGEMWLDHNRVTCRRLLTYGAEGVISWSF